MVTSSMDMSYFRQEEEEAKKNGSDVLFIADSIEELAEKTGIDAENLKNIIDTYNSYCDSQDELFHKSPKYLLPIKGPKYYALKLGLSAYGSAGGIKINYNTEVLNDDLNVIKGLYAAGTDANSLYNPDYAFVLPGNSLGFALNSGRIAGKSTLYPFILGNKVLFK